MENFHLRKFPQNQLVTVIQEKYLGLWDIIWMNGKFCWGKISWLAKYRKIRKIIFSCKYTGIQYWVSRYTCSQWLDIQEQWRQLEAILTLPSTAQSFKEEAADFESISCSWVELMASASQAPGVIECCDGEVSRVEVLSDLGKRLEHCKQSLSLYLHSKRQVQELFTSLFVVLFTVVCLHYLFAQLPSGLSEVFLCVWRLAASNSLLPILPFLPHSLPPGAVHKHPFPHHVLTR